MQILKGPVGIPHSLPRWVLSDYPGLRFNDQLEQNVRIATVTQTHFLCVTLIHNELTFHIILFNWSYYTDYFKLKFGLLATKYEVNHSFLKILSILFSFYSNSYVSKLWCQIIGHCRELEWRPYLASTRRLSPIEKVESDLEELSLWNK